MDPTLRERLDALWRDEIASVAERLFGGWRAQVEEILAEQAAAGKRDTVRLNQAVRRLRQAEEHADWVQALLAAARLYTAKAALFSTLDERLRLESAAPGFDIPLAAAPAFASVVETGDLVVCLASAAELSEAVFLTLAPEAGAQVRLFPLVCDGQACAVLYAEPGDDSALELLAAIAAFTLEIRLAKAEAPGLLSIAPAPPPRSWDALPKEERQLHLQAQRCARVRASQMRLASGSAIEAGRHGRDIYAALKTGIDEAREEYRRQFMQRSPAMVDYLHLEIVRILTNDDSDLLGPEYPGPLA